jgi:hypothetical protein
MGQKEKLELVIEQLEERIAPSKAPGLLGYEGQPGNQGGHGDSLQGCEDSQVTRAGTDHLKRGRRRPRFQVVCRASFSRRSSSG